MSLCKNLLLFSVLVTIPNMLVAQVEGPTDDFIFQEDSKQSEKYLERQQRQLMSVDPALSGQLDVRAPRLEYLQGTDSVKGEGGMIISGEGLQVQADSGVVDLKTKDADLQDNFLMTSPEGEIAATSAKMNFDSETGTFGEAEFSLADGEYRVVSDEVKKLSDLEYELENAKISTCHCPDGAMPWCIQASRTHITEESYAHNYNATVNMWDYPIMYLPWVAFPVKSERASGLLVPEFGYSGEDGALYKQPIFIVPDDYSDFTFTPFIETKTRNGLGVDYRRAFSPYSSWSSRVVYSNESPRDGDLRGTQVDDLFDPTFDEDRWGGFIQQTWRADPESGLNLALLSDIRLISDDLFLREIDDEDIGRRNSRYTTSTVSARAGLGEYASASLGGEFNQSLLTDDDLIFQRLPEFVLNSSRSFRPFGFNPYGLKLVLGGTATATQFDRKTGYDGLRVDIDPRLRIPFRYKNYVNSEIAVGYRYTSYELDETFDPRDGDFLESSENRDVFSLTYSTSTELERIFEVDSNSWLTYFTSIGSQNQYDRLRRVKHTIEPFVKYQYVPDEEQDALPLFDSQDRIRERSLLTYGFRSSLYGRFGQKSAGADAIAELTPTLEDLPTLDTTQPLSDRGEPDAFGSLGMNVPVARGLIREIASFEAKQSYDHLEQREDNDLNRRPFSDVGTAIGIYPTTNFAASFQTNYNVERHRPASWAFATHLKDDRGDAIRARYSYINNSVSQLEANLEIVLSDRLKLGAYSRYDDEDHEFIENQLLLRIESSCNCWYFDVGYGSRINPDNDKVLVNFTFKGLGDISQDFRVYKQENG